MTRSLGQLLADALTLSATLKAKGASRKDRWRGLEGLLRQHLPTTRVWKHLCQACEDTGFVFADCTGHPGTAGACDRPRLHLAHSYGRPCLCPKGIAFRPKPKPQLEEFAAAGKTPTRSGFTRAGRR